MNKIELYKKYKIEYYVEFEYHSNSVDIKFVYKLEIKELNIELEAPSFEELNFKLRDLLNDITEKYYNDDRYCYY